MANGNHLVVMVLALAGGAGCTTGTPKVGSDDPPSIEPTLMLSPNRGLTYGGTLVTIQIPAEYRIGITVSFGQEELVLLPAADNRDGVYLASTPPGSRGTVDVVLSSASGMLTLEDGFEYVDGTRDAGQMLVFDGDDVVTVDNVDSSVRYTAEGWIQLTDPAESQALFGQRNDPWTNCNYGAYLDWSAQDGFCFRMSRPQCSTSTSVCTGLPVQTDGWTHLAATFDGKEMRLYRDGELVGRRVDPEFERSNYLLFGATRHFSGFSSHFVGAMDEVRFWSRVRTVEEIRDGMHRHLSPDQPGLESYWSFDEGQWPVVDVTPRGAVGRPGGPSASEPVGPTWQLSTAPVFDY